MQITVEVCEQQGEHWVYGVFAIVRVQLKSGAAHDDVGCGSGRDKDRMKAMEAAKKGAVTDARKRALRCFGELLGNSLKHHDNPTSQMPSTDEHATPPPPASEVRHIQNQQNQNQQNQNQHNQNQQNQNQQSHPEQHPNQVKQQQLKEQQERNRQAALARQKQNLHRQQPMQKRNSVTSLQKPCTDDQQQQFDYNLHTVSDAYGNEVDSESDNLAMLEVAEQMERMEREAQHKEASGAKRVRIT